MNKAGILAIVDHTLLKPLATTKEIDAILEEAHLASCASACIAPCYVARARKYFDAQNSKCKVCTVIGFPLAIIP